MMEKVYINRDCCLGYIVLALHTFYKSATKEFKINDLVEEIKTMFIVYKDENELIQKMNKILDEEGDKRLTFCIGEERLGITIAECAELLGVSKQLMAEIVREQGFPCLKFKRRILINRNKVQDWLDNNSGRKIRY